jgi:NADH dehydrogenase
MHNRQRIIIIGAGFAGLRLARYLNGVDCEVFLIDRHNYHQFQPLMYQVATARLEPSSISFPLRKVFQYSKNVNIRITEVQKVDTDKKIVHTPIEDLSYDRLVIALGCTTNYFGNDRIESASFPMKSVPQAMALRNRILDLRGYHRGGAGRASIAPELCHRRRRAYRRRARRGDG